MTEPEWTRIRPSLKQKSIIHYIITDAQLGSVRNVLWMVQI